MPKPHIIIVNGPNLNLLGKRQIDIYGSRSFESFFADLKTQYDNVLLACYQSNHEGDIIDKLQDVGFSADGIILNAGGYTHTSIAIADTVSAIACPVVEVHISDIYNREPFRQHSYLTAVCDQTIVGQGLDGYRQAIDHLLTLAAPK